MHACFRFILLISIVLIAKWSISSILGGNLREDFFPIRELDYLLFNKPKFSNNYKRLTLYGISNCVFKIPYFGPSFIKIVLSIILLILLSKILFRLFLYKL